MADKDKNVHNKNDFISRQAAIRIVCNDECDDCPDGGCDMYRRLKRLPAADVKPIVKAEWLNRMDGTGICSNCHRLDHIDPLATHCRFCGAYMIEDKEDYKNV